MSEIYANKEVDATIRKRAYAANTEQVLEVRINPLTHELIFIGTEALAQALEHGIDIERYLSEKLTQMRNKLHLQKGE